MHRTWGPTYSDLPLESKVSGESPWGTLGMCLGKWGKLGKLSCPEGPNLAQEFLWITKSDDEKFFLSEK